MKSAFRHLIHSKIFLDIASSILESEKIEFCDSTGIKVNPRSVSQMRGIKNFNIKTLKERFNIESVKIIPDISIPEYAVIIN